MRNLENTNITVVHEDEGKPTSGPDTSTEVHLQEVPRNPKLKKYEKAIMFAAVNSVTETTKDFYEDKKKKHRISEEFSNVPGQTQ